MGRFQHYCAALFIAFIAVGAIAAQNKVTLSISLREEYNDNFRLTTAPHSRVLATTVSPAARFTYATDTLSASGKAQINFNRYRGDSQLNGNDVLLDGSLKKTFPLDQLSLLTSYVRDSTLASELAQTGVVQANRQRTRLTLNPEWTGTISARAFWNAGFDLTNITYQDAINTDLVDYRILKGYTAYSYRLTERSKAFVSAGISQLKVDRPGDKTRTLFALMGLEHDISEVWKGEVSAGLRRVRLPDNGNFTNQTGWLGQGSLARSFDTGLLRLAVARELNPTGLGLLTQTDKLSLGWSDKFNPRLSYDLSAAAYRNAFISPNAGANRDRYFRIDAHISYALTQDWIIDSGIAFARLDPDVGNSAQSRSIYLSARYEWSKQLPSR